MEKLKALLDELVTGIQAIPAISHCGTTPKRRDDIHLPAVLLDMIELEPGQDPGTGELELISHWEARVLYSDKEPLWIGWALVQEVMLFLFNHSWSAINVGRANIKQASPDHFSPELQGHSIWLIEWTQKIRISESVWDSDCPTPSIVVVNWFSELDTNIEDDRESGL